MSNDATNWASKQRGIPPITKIVLWQLCDRFHPDNGCFPSQETLAHDCEISRASLNRHLNLLEERGIIRREQRVNPDTKRRASTVYHLVAYEAWSHVSNMDMDGPEPCLKSDEKPCLKMRHYLSNKEEPVIREDIATNVAHPLAGCPYGEIAELWNASLSPKVLDVARWSEKRKRAARTIWNGKRLGQDLEVWARFVRRIADSPFLTGDNDRGWRADLDWMLNDTNLAKLEEGKYDERGRVVQMPRKRGFVV